MKKFFVFLFFVFLGVGTVFSQSIKITHPAAGDKLYLKNSYTIIWNRTAGLSPQVKILLFRGSVKAGVIAESTSNNGRYRWTVPSSLDEGDYKIRIVSIGSAIFDDSGVFSILKPVEIFAGGVSIQQDLEMKDVLYDLSGGGWIAAVIKNSYNPYKGDLEFLVFFPNGGSAPGSTLNYIKNVDLRAGQQQQINLMPASQLAEFPFCGKRVQVTVDLHNRVKETNETNNSLQKTIQTKRAELAVSVSNLEVKKAYMKGYKWKINFRIHVRAGGYGYTTLPGLLVMWMLKEPGAGTTSIFKDTVSWWTPMNRNEEKVIVVEKKFGHPDLSHSSEPRLADGVYSIVVEVHGGDTDGPEICEQNMSNNRIQFTVTLE